MEAHRLTLGRSSWAESAKCKPLQAGAPTRIQAGRCSFAGSVRPRRGALRNQECGRFDANELEKFHGRQWIRSRSVPDVAKEVVPFEVAPAVERSALRDFIVDGVLASKTGAVAERVEAALDHWVDLGGRLAHQLKFHEDGLTDSEKIRIYQYYLPIFFWCEDQLAAHKSSFAAGERVPPLVIGINAPQGCGKTTIVESLDFLFNTIGRRTTAISIDDFYLTGADQDKLASDNSDNGLLEFRGNAGSHDLQFGTETIKSLLNLTPGSTAKVPRYNKAARSGRGDRGDESMWSLVEGPLEVILFEGWMLGFEPQDNQAVSAIDPQLALVNKFLEGYYDAWHSFINSWIIVEVEDPSWVFEWRLEAEVLMRKKGKGGMTDEQIAEFVSRYIPAYKAYLPDLYSSGPRGSTAQKTLKFKIDQGRNPIA